ncbi:MAG TPA: MarR family transcriptional regulator [Gaiellaceae bacterium]|nr:MarR family transcriptional regulator [Gaiellaceae bacterium]
MLEPDHAEALLTEISELYALVLRIARRVHDDPEAMTATQRLALIDIAAIGPVRPNHLARLMDTTPATVTRAIDALEEWGLVARRSDPKDGRGVLVAVTARGARWAERRGKLVREALGQLPSSAAPARLIKDLARLNEELRKTSGHSDVSRGALLAP